MLKRASFRASPRYGDSWCEKASCSKQSKDQFALDLFFRAQLKQDPLSFFVSFFSTSSLLKWKNELSSSFLNSWFRFETFSPRATILKKIFRCFLITAAEEMVRMAAIASQGIAKIWINRRDGDIGFAKSQFSPLPTPFIQVNLLVGSPSLWVLLFLLQSPPPVPLVCSYPGSHPPMSFAAD